MQTFSFVAPLPLRKHAPNGAVVECFGRRTHTACVAKPPSREPQSDSISEFTTRKEEKSTNPSSPARSTEEITAAELSKKLSRAVGFDLILEDVTRLTRFFRSFIKQKSTNDIQEQASNDLDSVVQSETSLAVPTQSQSYKPRSATGTSIATAYTVARGAVDRAFQTFSIHAQSYLNAATQVAGDTVCKILSVGHQTFPGLKLGEAKDAVAGVLKDGWTPLSVFQWQLSAGSDDSLEQRRQVRIQQISKFFRGGGISDFLNVTGSALSGVGGAAEKLAPIMFRGVSKATSGYFERAHYRKLPKPTSGSKKVISKKHKYKPQRDQGNYPQHLPKRALKSSIGADMEITAKATGTLQAQRLDVGSSKICDETSSAILSISSDQIYVGNESQERTLCDTHSATAAGSPDNSANEVSQKGNNVLLRSGAMVLAAGAIATAAASVSVPTAITCSTLMVASMALSGAKTANAAELQIRARHRVRQSRSVQNLEGALLKAAIVSNMETKVPRALLPPAVQRMQRGNDAMVHTTNPLPTGAKTGGSAGSSTIEASAYAVSASKPRIMSVPIVGILFYWLDLMAYHAEGVVQIFLRRSGLSHTLNNERAGWQLLRSFERNSHPD